MDRFGDCPLIDTSTPLKFRYKDAWNRALIGVFGFSLFTAGGVRMISIGDNRGWFVAGLSGLMLSSFVLRLFPKFAGIEISRQCFICRNGFRSISFPWHDIQSFDYDPTCDVVVFAVAELASRHPGEQLYVPRVYGIVPLDLTNLLNDWKRATESADEEFDVRVID